MKVEVEMSVYDWGVQHIQRCDFITRTCLCYLYCFLLLLLFLYGSLSFVRPSVGSYTPVGGRGRWAPAGRLPAAVAPDISCIVFYNKIRGKTSQNKPSDRPQTAIYI